MKVILAGGGTGGHAYPAMAVAEELCRAGDSELVYYGTAGGPERQVAEGHEIPYRVVPASAVRGRSPVTVASGLYRFWRGSRTAAERLSDDDPDAVFATGGYAAAPIGRAAARLGIPLVVFLPDVRPGWAVRLLQRYATVVACSVPQSLSYLPAGKSVVTGYPVRRQFHEATREEGINHFELQRGVQTLLIAGGSLGAHQINIVVHNALQRLLAQMQIVHITGRAEYQWLERARQQLPDWQQQRYRVHAYTERMAYAMAAADLAVTRAGASTLGELPIRGLPAIVIPGEFSDQQANAAYLSDHGAAVTLAPSEIGDLVDLVSELLDDQPRIEEMGRAASDLARPDAAARLAGLVREAAS